MIDCAVDCETLSCRVCGVAVSGCDVRRNCSGVFGKTPVRRSGVGSELTKILHRFGIRQTARCQCATRAAALDATGIDEASKPERIEEAVGWLEEEATRRRLPFSRLAARLLIKRAISNARRASRGQEEGSATV